MFLSGLFAPLLREPLKGLNCQEMPSLHGAVALEWCRCPSNLQRYLLQHSSRSSTNTPALERNSSHEHQSIQLCCTARNNLPPSPLLCSAMEEIALSR